VELVLLEIGIAFDCVQDVFWSTIYILYRC